MSIVNKVFFLGNPKRKIILINPEFQLSIINMIVYFFMLIMLVIYLGIWYFYRKVKQDGIDAGIPLGSDYFIFVGHYATIFNIMFLVVAVISLIIIYYFGLLLSHRIAGPIFRIDKKIEDIINQKEVSRIVLRENDYFKEHAEHVNCLIDELERRK